MPIKPSQAHWVVDGLIHTIGTKKDPIVAPTTPVIKSVNKGLSVEWSFRVIIKYKPYKQPVAKAAKVAKFNSMKPGRITTKDPRKPTITADHLLIPTFSSSSNGDKAVVISGATNASVRALDKEITEME